MAIGMIYTRVSTKEQAEKRLSLDNQEKECKAFGRKQIVSIPDANIFRDEGGSAKNSTLVAGAGQRFPRYARRFCVR